MLTLHVISDVASAAARASTDSAPAAAARRPMSAESGSVVLCARPLAWPDPLVCAAATSAYALLQPSRTVPEGQPRLDVYA